MITILIMIVSISAWIILGIVTADLVMSKLAEDKFKSLTKDKDA